MYHGDEKLVCNGCKKKGFFKSIENIKYRCDCKLGCHVDEECMRKIEHYCKESNRWERGLKFIDNQIPHEWENYKSFIHVYCDYCGGKIKCCQKSLICKVKNCKKIAHIECRDKFTHNCPREITDSDNFYCQLGNYQSVPRRMQGPEVVSQIYREQKIPEFKIPEVTFPESSKTCEIFCPKTNEVIVEDLIKFD